MIIFFISLLTNQDGEGLQKIVFKVNKSPETNTGILEMRNLLEPPDFLGFYHSSGNK